MEYKIHQYRYDIFSKFEAIIRSAMEELGHTETSDLSADVHIYNHCLLNEISTQDKINIIFKPTAPSADYFALDTIGYAGASELAFEEPVEVGAVDFTDAWSIVDKLKKDKANKWDDSILLKWRKGKRTKSDHILVIGQMPDDETVTNFSFGDHTKKLESICRTLKDERNVVLKLHPRYKPTKEFIKRIKSYNVEIIDGFISIHDILPHTKVAIIENSTAGIECMMHDVPIISYGYPEYHWVTKKLQSLTQLPYLVKDTHWYDSGYAINFVCWYINHYLCRDINTTRNRLRDFEL